MILPTTYLAALLLTIISMLCWGSWANTTKMSKKWRFELFYFDYSFGVFLAAVIAAFTFGSIGGETTDANVVNFGFMDNMSIATKRQMASAFLGGTIFNLANMLLVAAITVAGLSVAFPIGIGLALVIGVGLNYWLRPDANGNPTFLFSGVGLVLAAIVVTALAHAAYKKLRPPVAPAATHQQQAPPSYTRPAHSHKKSGPGIWKGVVLSLFAGLLMGCFYPLVEFSRMGDMGLSPYSAAFVFSLGVLSSTFFYNLFFMNLPVEGEPVTFRDYFRGSGRNHLLGLLGGAIWSIGAISNFVAASAPERVQVGGAVSYAIGQGATLVSTLWGLLYWKEFAGANGKVKGLLGLMLALFAVGLGLVAAAPLMTGK